MSAIFSIISQTVLMKSYSSKAFEIKTIEDIYFFEVHS